MCLVACGAPLSSTDVPSYAAARMPLGVLRRSMCSGGLVRLESEAGALYELCLDSGWAYWAGRWWWRLMPSGVLLWRRREGGAGAGGVLWV